MNANNVNTIDCELWRKAVLPINSTIQQAINNLNESSCQIVLVISENNTFLGTLTDGDIRRGLLDGFDLRQPIESLIHKKALIVSPTIPRETVMQIMVTNKIHQIPVVNEQHQLVGLYLWDKITIPPIRSNLMVIMVGGVGTRLRPHTENCPKPLLPVAGKPILEHIIDRAKLEGFSRFVFATHYLGHMIEDYFGQGERLNVQIDYVREKSPLGTAGALSLLTQRPCTPFIVTNGDVLTDVRYGELLDFHVHHHAIGTMAVRAHEWQHPFGVVQTNGIDIINFEEKPVTRSYINAGIYALSVEALSVLSSNVHCDMPSLFERVKAVGGRTVAYPMHEPWLDVGRPSDLATARLISAKEFA